MSRASVTYRSRIDTWLVLVTFGAAVAMLVTTIAIYRHSPQERDEFIADLSNRVAASRPAR